MNEAELESSACEALTRSGAPSISMAVVKDSRISQLCAFGLACAGTPARPDMRYAIGSITKQFTAAAVLTLADSGQLTLDDNVARWFPNLTCAGDITLRHLLSHTSGYIDYFPQRSVPQMMRAPTCTAAIIANWACGPLAFAPGTGFEYSNTGYVVAGAIVERVAGKTLFEVLRERIFVPLGMNSVVGHGAKPLGAGDAQPHTRAGLGPLRIAEPEAPGWTFATADLAMTAEDLARWNISLLAQNLLSPAAYQAFLKPIFEKDGQSYSLGLAHSRASGRRVISHSGQISGFLSENRIYPDAGSAITVLSNTDAATAHTDVADRAAFLLLAPDRTERAIRVAIEGLRLGTLAADGFAPHAKAYFTPDVIADYRESLAGLGPLRALTSFQEMRRGNLTLHAFKAIFGESTVTLRIAVTDEGLVEEFLLLPVGD